jgi:hypothetical protein
MTIVYNHHHEKSLSDYMETTHRILKDRVADDYKCYYCLSNHTNNDTLMNIIQTYNNHVKQQMELVRLRVVLYIFGIFNIIIVFIVYYGPVTINLLTTANAVLLLSSLFVDKFDVMIFMESIVVFMSVVIIFQVSYCIVITICSISIREFNKNE